MKRRYGVIGAAMLAFTLFSTLINAPAAHAAYAWVLKSKRPPGVDTPSQW